MKKAVWILVFILVVIIVAQHIFAPKPKTKIKIIRTTDTLKISITKYKPVPLYKDTGSTKYIHDTTNIPTLVDTEAILKDYIRVRLYKDTLLNDSSAFILVNDRVQYNRITSRKPVIHIYFKQTTITLPPRRILLVGLGVGYRIVRFGASAKIMYLDRQRHAYGLSYDLMNKFFEVSLFWTIKNK